MRSIQAGRDGGLLPGSGPAAGLPPPGAVALDRFHPDPAGPAPDLPGEEPQDPDSSNSEHLYIAIRANRNIILHSHFDCSRRFWWIRAVCQAFV
jgi:hypothetical protein